MRSKVVDLKGNAADWTHTLTSTVGNGSYKKAVIDSLNNKKRILELESELRRSNNSRYIQNGIIIAFSAIAIHFFRKSMKKDEKTKDSIEEIEATKEMISNMSEEEVKELIEETQNRIEKEEDDNKDD